MSKTVVLIHGAWLNAKSWEGFKARYEGQGYTVVAPDWPYDDRDPAALRADPDPGLKTLGQRQILDHYEAIIRALPEEPILIGHSLGGVFVQHLLDRGLGVAGVAIDPAPTPGIPLGPHAIYDRYIVPTPGRVYWNGVVGKIKIDWMNPNRAPLLLIGGEIDLIADASMTRAIFKKQRQAPSLTEYKEYPGRSHWTGIDAGWEQVADDALEWAVAHARPDKIATISRAA